jgi:hypothetical protein
MRPGRDPLVAAHPVASERTLAGAHYSPVSGWEANS